MNVNAVRQVRLVHVEAAGDAAAPADVSRLEPLLTFSGRGSDDIATVCLSITQGDAAILCGRLMEFFAHLGDERYQRMLIEFGWPPDTEWGMRKEF